MTNDLSTINHAQIEARARVLRAQAARNGFISFRDAISNVIASLFLRGSKAA